MLPRNDLNVGAVGRTEPVTRTEKIGEPGQEAFQRAMSTMLGRTVQATVAARLSDGSFLVNLNDTLARMQLPAGAQVGARLDLTLVSLTPRATFQAGAGAAATLVATPPTAAQAAAVAASLVQSGKTAAPTLPALPSALPSTMTPGGGILPLPTAASAPASAPSVPLPAADPGLLAGMGGRTAIHSQAHAAALLGKAPLTPSALLPASGEEGATSPTTLSQTAQMLGAVLRTALAQANSPGRILARSPITATPGMPPDQLAGALDEAVSKSGLFYESHVAEWSRGQRSMAQLAQEPLMQQMQQLQRAGAEIEAVRRQMSPAEPAIAQTIDLQLQVQEQQRVVWQGQVWPGQDMRWEIERRQDDKPAAPEAGDEAASWHSQLTLRFAALGDIGARLVLSGGQVLLRLDAASDEVAALLRARSGELEAALAAHGSAASVSVASTADSAPPPERPHG